MPTTISMNSPESPACHHCGLSVFCRSSEPPLQAALLKKIQREFDLPAGSTLCQRGACATDFLLVRSGVLKAVSFDREGKEIIHHFYLPREIIGFENLETGNFPYSIVIVKRAAVCQVSADWVREAMVHQPLLQKQFLRLMARRLNQAKSLVNYTAEQRLAYFLLDLRERLLLGDERMLELPFNREFIAAYLGLAVETISRLFRRFEDQGWLQVNRREVVFLKVEALSGLLESA